MKTPEKRMRAHLEFLYGEEVGYRTYRRLSNILQYFKKHNPRPARRTNPLGLSEQDAILITYPDQVQDGHQKPLATLQEFLTRHIKRAISSVHVLPFYPYSSDDGFAVIDFHQVDPAIGSWEDLARIGQSYRLMVDAVINHISRESDWFHHYLARDEPFTSFFIEVDPDEDTSSVVRPRDLPLLSRVETERGPRFVWATFSDDQIDLNYSNPEVMLAVIRILLLYIEKGAKIIRLDAIAYLWKEIGTACIHLPQTHAVVKLWRAIIDEVAPENILITETNVPHRENVQYFGGGQDEAQMVYQFTLAPLILHTFLTGETEAISIWVEDLEPPTPETTYLNFTASHDGIGIRPAEGILSQGQINALVENTRAHGGEVSLRARTDGSASVYELNITLYDFLNNPERPDRRLDVPRFLASQAIMLSLAGVPGIYFHSLFGSRNCETCVDETGRARSINRRKFRLAELEDRLSDPNHQSGPVFKGYLKLLRTRREQPAFHPARSQRVWRIDPAVFSVERGRGINAVLCLVNVTERPVDLSLPPGFAESLDLLSGSQASGSDFRLGPYQASWLTLAGDG